MKNNQKFLRKSLAVFSSTVILTSLPISVSAHPNNAHPKLNVPEIDVSDSVLDADLDELDAELNKLDKLNIPDINVSDSVLDAELDELDAELNKSDKLNAKNAKDFANNLPKAYHDELDAELDKLDKLNAKNAESFVNSLNFEKQESKSENNNKVHLSAGNASLNNN